MMTLSFRKSRKQDAAKAALEQGNGERWRIILCEDQGFDVDDLPREYPLPCETAWM